MPRRPRNDVSPTALANQRERRLNRVDMTDGLGLPELVEREVADAGVTNLALVDQQAQLAPAVGERRARSIGPMELIEIDLVDAEPAERGLELAPNRRRGEVALGLAHGVFRIVQHTAFGEDERAFPG